MGKLITKRENYVSNALIKDPSKAVSFCPICMMKARFPFSPYIVDSNLYIEAENTHNSRKGAEHSTEKSMYLANLVLYHKSSKSFHSKQCNCMDMRRIYGH